MTRTIIGLVVAFFAIVIGLSIYLQPNDLIRCGKSPVSGGNCQSVDAIVAISGGDTEARVNQAVNLYKNGWSDKLVFSGAAKDKDGPSNASAMKSQALAAGVPNSAIFVDENSESTKQNAENCEKIFITQNIESIILVTSAYHQRRAYTEFSRFATGVKIMNSPVSIDRNWSPVWWMTPWGWWLAIGELFKTGATVAFGV